MSRTSTNRSFLVVVGHFLSSQPQLKISSTWTERFPPRFVWEFWGVVFFDSKDRQTDLFLSYRGALNGNVFFPLLCQWIRTTFVKASQTVQGGHSVSAYPQVGLLWMLLIEH